MLAAQSQQKPQGVLKAVWAHMVIHRSQAAILGAAAFPLYPFNLPKRNKSRAAWVWLSTDCTYTGTYGTLRRTKRKRSSGLSSTQGGCYRHTGGIAPGYSYRYVQSTTRQSAGNWWVVIWGGGGGQRVGIGGTSNHTMHPMTAKPLEHKTTCDHRTHAQETCACINTKRID